MDFEKFKIGPAKHIMRALGESWAACLEMSTDYRHFRYLIIEMNNPNHGHFIKAVKRYTGVCSSGEYRLLLGLCCLCDFSHVADSLSKTKTWRTIGNGMDDDYRAALAACVANAGW